MGTIIWRQWVAQPAVTVAGMGVGRDAQRGAEIGRGTSARPVSRPLPWFLLFLESDTFLPFTQQLSDLGEPV